MAEARMIEMMATEFRQALDEAEDRFGGFTYQRQDGTLFAHVIRDMGKGDYQIAVFEAIAKDYAP